MRDATAKDLRQLKKAVADLYPKVKANNDEQYDQIIQELHEEEQLELKGPLSLDADRWTITNNETGDDVKLTEGEFGIAAILGARQNFTSKMSAYSFAELFEQLVMGDPSNKNDRARIDTPLSTLRKKLKRIGWAISNENRKYQLSPLPSPPGNSQELGE